MICKGAIKLLFNLVSNLLFFDRQKIRYFDPYSLWYYIRAIRLFHYHLACELSGTKYAFVSLMINRIKCVSNKRQVNKLNINDNPLRTVNYIVIQRWQRWPMSVVFSPPMFVVFSPSTISKSHETSTQSNVSKNSLIYRADPSTIIRRCKCDKDFLFGTLKR